jgi:serine/threonine protein kinase
VSWRLIFHFLVHIQPCQFILNEWVVFRRKLSGFTSQSFPPPYRFSMINASFTETSNPTISSWTRLDMHILLTSILRYTTQSVACSRASLEAWPTWVSGSPTWRVLWPHHPLPAPEILAKKGYSYTIDWWSLGVCAYELVFGRRPFRGRTNSDLTHSISREQLKFPEEAEQRCSREGLQAMKQVSSNDAFARSVLHCNPVS